jgi:prepilin-type N-terminal cleavage/methylation domain-containing protein
MIPRCLKSRSSILGCRAKVNRIRKQARSGFTLFELILAVALAATLLAMVGTAINLYLSRTDNGRTRVEEAQLARSVLTMIADDIRAASVYQKQDTAAIAQLMAAGTPFDVDDIDKAREMTGGTSAPGGLTAVAKLSALSSGSSGSGGSSSTGASSTGGATSGGSSTEESDQTMPLGLSGTANDVYVDVTRMPRQEEMFGTVTGYVNAPSGVTSSQPSSAGGTTTAAGDVNPPSDLKSVHYYVRQGNAVEAGSAATTSLAPDAQAAAGGLVRQEIPRNQRVFAETSGDNGVLSSGMALIAPEVVQIQFRYFDGSQLVDEWDMRTMNKLPVAIEVCIWVRPEAADSAAAYSSTGVVSGAHVYRQVVNLPMSRLSEANAMSAASAATDASGTSSSTGTSSTGSSSTGTGSAFGDE